jgi:hypothetical protein
MNTVDEKNLHLTKARKAVSDATLVLLEAISRLEETIASESYQRGHDDGVAWFNQEIKRVTRESADPEPIPAKPYVLTEVDRIMQDSIVSYVTDSPGLRTIDITTKIIALPVKPALTEKSIRLTINRLKSSGKIEDKAGRWYLTGAKPPAQAYKVMTYLEDGSKYLAADVIK